MMMVYPGLNTWTFSLAVLPALRPGLCLNVVYLDRRAGFTGRRHNKLECGVPVASSTLDVDLGKCDSSARDICWGYREKLYAGCEGREILSCWFLNNVEFLLLFECPVPGLQPWALGCLNAICSAWTFIGAGYSARIYTGSGKRERGRADIWN